MRVTPTKQLQFIGFFIPLLQIKTFNIFFIIYCMSVCTLPPFASVVL